MTTTTREQRLNLKPGIITTGLALVVSGGVSTWAWHRLPGNARIPTVWGPTGEITSYADKLPGLALWPGIILLVGVIFVVAPRVSPRQRNLAASDRGYSAGWIGSMVFMVALHTAAAGCSSGSG